MLKLLLIGFTQTNANVIQIFIEMTFKDIHVDSIIRQVNEGSLSLPILDEQQRGYDIFIIDFEGVGLNLNDKNIAQKLEIYTTGKPILFVSRQNSVVPVSLVHYEWLTLPYSRQQMTESVKNMLAKIKPVNTTQVLPKGGQNVSMSANASLIKTAAGLEGQIKRVPVSPKAESLEYQVTNEEIKQVFDVLADVFVGINEQPFFNFVKSLQITNEFTQVVISHYDIYLNPISKSVVAMNLERIVDSFTVGLRQDNISFVKLDSSDFRQKVNGLLAQGAKQYSISQLIWFIGMEIMQTKRYDYYETHQLKFEARYMPNITGMKFVPKYVIPVIASCLGRARGLADFNTLFPYLTNEQINQIMILLSISQAIRSDVLLDSVKNMPPKPTQVVDTTANIGVQKANKTGFLKRLLIRLGV